MLQLVKATEQLMQKHKQKQLSKHPRKEKTSASTIDKTKYYLKDGYDPQALTNILSHTKSASKIAEELMAGNPLKRLYAETLKDEETFRNLFELRTVREEIKPTYFTDDFFVIAEDGTLGIEDLSSYYYIEGYGTDAEKIVGYIQYSMYQNGICNLEYVSIHPKDRGKGHCKNMIYDFITEREKDPRVKNFNLENKGGVQSCKCYVGAFTQHGYSGTHSDGKIISNQTCEGADLDLSFLFTKSTSTSGGRRSSLSQRHRNMAYARFPTAKHQRRHAALPLHRRTVHASRCGLSNRAIHSTQYPRRRQHPRRCVRSRRKVGGSRKVSRRRNRRAAST